MGNGMAIKCSTLVLKTGLESDFIPQWAYASLPLWFQFDKAQRPPFLLFPLLQSLPGVLHPQIIHVLSNLYLMVWFKGSQIKAVIFVEWTDKCHSKHDLYFIGGRGDWG